MNVRQVDDQGSLWFLMANDSYAAKEVASDPAVKLFFQGSSHSDFLYLVGWAAIVTDRSKLKELWEPVLKTWFTEGQEDPRIAIVRVTPTEGNYWDTKHGNFVAGIKIMIGAALGKTLDDSIVGKIRI
jgi:general stress protein 26